MYYVAPVNGDERLGAWYNNWGDLWGDIQGGYNWVTGQRGQNVRQAGQVVTNVGDNLSNLTHSRVDTGQVLLYVALGAGLVMFMNRPRSNPRGYRRRRRR